MASFLENVRLQSVALRIFEALYNAANVHVWKNKLSRWQSLWLGLSL